jgi:copper chaperone CopZ
VAVGQDAPEKVYIKIEVNGLSCPFCAYGLEKKLKKIPGSENIKIELKEGLAILSVPKSTQPTKEELETIIKDAGFTPGNISFSDQSFKLNENE